MVFTGSHWNSLTCLRFPYLLGRACAMFEKNSVAHVHKMYVYTIWVYGLVAAMSQTTFSSSRIDNIYLIIVSHSLILHSVFANIRDKNFCVCEH